MFEIVLMHCPGLISPWARIGNRASPIISMSGTILFGD